MNIILASASPRREELMGCLTKDFRVVPSDFPEREVLFKGDAAAYSQELALKKALAVAADYPQDLVIGSDTVVFARGELLNKPMDRADARRMMNILQGGCHEVVTGYALICANQGLHKTGQVSTKVFFQPMSAEEIEEYLDAGDYMGKAGAYAIQGAAARFVEGIEGDFYSVVGLPVARLYKELKGLNLI